MRISDWSSDVCSSDLQRPVALGAQRDELGLVHAVMDMLVVATMLGDGRRAGNLAAIRAVIKANEQRPLVGQREKNGDRMDSRKTGREGKRGSVRVNNCGCRDQKKKKKE